MILVSGGFDPLHPGHVAYLNAAREFGDGYVVCSLASDAEVAKKHRNVLSHCDRGLLLLSTKLVDDITYRPVTEALETIRPTHYVKGKDWEGQLPADQIETCHRLGIHIAFTDTVTHSSTKLLQGPTIADFERLVLSQKPADKPWEPTAAVPYDFESRRIAEGKHPELIRDVFKPERVVDAGCGPGYLTRMLRGLGLDVVAFDSEWYPESGDLAVWQADLLTLEEHSFYGGNDYNPPQTETFRSDLVICREVLEHLTVVQIRKAVQNLCAMSTKYVYVTTRFNMGPRSLWDVQTSDDLDPTHQSMLPKDLLRSFFVLEGFKQRADLEAAMDWKGLGRCLVYERA